MTEQRQVEKLRQPTRQEMADLRQEKQWILGICITLSVDVFGNEKFGQEMRGRFEKINEPFKRMEGKLFCQDGFCLSPLKLQPQLPYPHLIDRTLRVDVQSGSTLRQGMFE